MTSRRPRHFDHHWDRTPSVMLKEFFEWVEKRWNEWPRRGVTAEETAEKFGTSILSARTKLSRYSNHWDEYRQCFRHYLVRVKFSDDGGKTGHYIPGPDWWGEVVFSSEMGRYTGGIATCEETNVNEWLKSIGCIRGKFDKVRG
jgi:hypothetical protein